MLPIKVAEDPGNAHLDKYPLLAVGESMTVRGYEITVVADERRHPHGHNRQDRQPIALGGRAAALGEVPFTCDVELTAWRRPTPHCGEGQLGDYYRSPDVR